MSPEGIDAGIVALLIAGCMAFVILIPTALELCRCRRELAALDTERNLYRSCLEHVHDATYQEQVERVIEAALLGKRTW